MNGVEISNGHEDNSVLIVNDDPDQLRLMGSLLSKAGYSIVTAFDGLDGLTLARRERPDVVISDVSMPRMDGLEFCREMRADTELKTVPILLVTALQKDTESAVAGERRPRGGLDHDRAACRSPQSPARRLRRRVDRPANGPRELK